MKMNKLIGIIAIVAVIGLMFAACEEDSSGGAPGTLSVKKPANLPAFTVAAPKNTSEANDLVNAARNFISNIGISQFFDIAAYAKYGVTGQEYFGDLIGGDWEYDYDTGNWVINPPTANPKAINLDKKSISASVKLDGSTINSFKAYYDYTQAPDTLPAEDTPSSFTDYIKKYMDSDFTGAVNVKGNASMSWSSNLTKAEYNAKTILDWAVTTPASGVTPSAFAKGDKYSENTKTKTEWEITDGFVTFERYSSLNSGYINYKIAGFFVEEDQEKRSWTLEEVVRDFWKGSNDTSGKKAYSFTIYTDEPAPFVNYGAKVTFSASKAGTWSVRASKWEGGDQDTEILVYDNAGTLLFTLDSSYDNF